MQARRQVICLPGGVAPAAVRYAPLRALTEGRADLHLKDLEVYRSDPPPEGHSIEMELAGLDELAGSLGLDRFDLVGYSGGGFVSLAYAGTRPDRILSLALFEPAFVPGDMTPPEQEFADEIRTKLAGLEGAEFMSAFVREQVRPGVVLPPPPPSSPAMRARPAGIAVLIRAFAAYKFDRDRLRASPFPAYYAYGDQSHAEQAVKAGVLAQLFPDIRVQRFSGVHHFVAPEAIYTAEHARSVLELWERAGAT